MLVVGALLFVRSLAAVRVMHLGFEPDRVLMVNRVLRGTPLDRDAQTALRRTLLDAARAHPAVEAATWRASTPLGTTLTLGFSVDGVESVRDLGMFAGQKSTGDYFKTVGTRILQGRPFTDEDRAGTPAVVVVSESMARVCGLVRTRLAGASASVRRQPHAPRSSASPRTSSPTRSPIRSGSSATFRSSTPRSPEGPGCSCGYVARRRAKSSRFAGSSSR